MEGDVTIALWAIASSKSVETDWLHAELLKLGLSQDQSILLEFHRLITIIWCEGKVPQRCNDVTIMTTYNKGETILKLLRYFSGVSCRQSAPQGGRRDAWRHGLKE